MSPLVSAYCAVRHASPPGEESLVQVVLSILALAWCGFAWYAVVWLLVG